MAHLKRLGIPGSWPMPRKGSKFAVRPSPGPHAIMQCMPLRVILRDLLGYADNAKESMSILSQGKVLVDKKARKSSRFPVGLMDVIEIPDARVYFRVVAGRSGLILEKTDESGASCKTCRITGKTTLKKGVQQLNLHDGRNILVKKDTYRVGDSVSISLPDQKILSHALFAKGSDCFVTGGRNIGIRGTIKEINNKKHMLEKSTVTIDVNSGSAKKEIKTLKKHIFISGKPGTPGREDK